MNFVVPHKDIQIIAVVFPSLGVLFTIARLGLRLRSHRFWWDDAFALASGVATAYMGATTYIHYMQPDQFSRATRIAAYYSLAEAFGVSVWFARLSILNSILRIVPDKSTKRLLHRSAITFGFVIAFLSAQVLWVCENQPNWKDEPQPQCALGLQVAICQLLTDIVADALLIVIPIRLFTRSHLPRSLKIRLLVIFSAGALTTVVSLVHAIFILEVRGQQAIISALFEISVSLIVCNLIVVVPAFWRSCGVDDPDSHASRERDRTFRASTVRFGPTTRPHVTVQVDTTVTASDSAINFNRKPDAGTTKAGIGNTIGLGEDEYEMEPPRKVIIRQDRSTGAEETEGSVDLGTMPRHDKKGEL